LKILETVELSKNYGKREAVKKVSFDIERGEIFALIGPNGAGKTTTLRMIATLLFPTSGNAYLCGESLVKNPVKIRESITYLPDEAGAYKNMKGADYLKFMAELYTKTPQEAEKAIEFAKNICGLGDRLNDKIAAYSKGMIRKLLITRAVMTRPRLAIFDEPTGGLDVMNALEVRELIRNLASEGMSFLISSHNMLEIEYLSEKVALINNGEIIERGSPAELKARHSAANLEEVFAHTIKENVWKGEVQL
jgi:ABC-2 type transport system ATP-binding protein